MLVCVNMAIHQGNCFSRWNHDFIITRTGACATETWARDFPMGVWLEAICSCPFNGAGRRYSSRDWQAPLSPIDRILAENP